MLTPGEEHIGVTQSLHQVIRTKAERLAKKPLCGSPGKSAMTAMASATSQAHRKERAAQKFLQPSPPGPSGTHGSLTDPPWPSARLLQALAASFGWAVLTVGLGVGRRGARNVLTAISYIKQIPFNG